MTTEWMKKVERTVRAIPKGKTAGYALVAIMAGRPGGARAVVRALHALHDVPWWRVVRSDGTVAEAIRAKQVRALAKEGVRCVNGRVPASAQLSRVSGSSPSRR
jgi:methylated-DNA-protein-cysteine methyltransferase related protein